MYPHVYMSGKAIYKLMEEIKDILKKNKELSIRQLSIKTGSQWITIEKALKSMKSLGIVKERIEKKDKRKSRLFRNI